MVSAALLVGAFSLGSSRGGGSAPPAQAATLTSASATRTGRITVTGTGTVTGVPNQLVLSAGVQVNSYSVTSALDQASQVVRNVTAALTQRGVAASDIQTSDLNISPNYSGSSPYPTSYGVTRVAHRDAEPDQPGRRADPGRGPRGRERDPASTTSR